MSFMIRPLKPGSTIGEELATVRRRLSIPLREASEKTRIQRRYLKALEENRWQDLPEPLYTRNFLRNYARFLGEDPAYFLSRFKEERGCCDLLTPSQMPRQRVRKGRFLVTPRLLKLGVLSLLLLGVTGYLGFQVRSILEPPSLSVVSPEDGSKTDSAILIVLGVIKEEARIKVNGETVLPSKDGTFEATIMLERGLNIIAVEGKKRYSRPATIYRMVVFDPPAGDRAALSLYE
ncbi:TPA: hypothetical protein DDZ10_03985 [Candidatus Uhrbacteria bacterium]|uniref:Transcriptional regulator, XRE family n=1 Tax=Candidatus Uhrbacteria bacterium GW2011_GWC2_53_7 TaxID=1618986 RepID=A0A0G1Y064_9BACT|nr:MAG: Transcriptional regulator, XRE family [Candidatus Uhrbacteria bacterium GW2011_GWC2_53_7]OGL71177.1 MAG: hypothetical protein A3D69_02560 [Candidatus Uhrbacteria bacterium RIFCSPHIGHO2_02_FULL_54_11]HBL39800.1 hypothetical protein [Candidatus Uhrbacteria bacterium]